MSRGPGSASSTPDCRLPSRSTSDEQKEHDHRRREWLRNHGWIVIVLDKSSFTPEALDAWLRELRVALRLAV